MNINDIIQTVTRLNWLEVIAALNGLILALIAIFALIPGEQPEKTLRAIAAFVGRFSRK
jgi:hypothetical protein